jgi:hypothetical protein
MVRAVLRPISNCHRACAVDERKVSINDDDRAAIDKNGLGKQANCQVAVSLSVANHVSKPSLRAQRSNPAFLLVARWIASSLRSSQ